MKAGRALSRVQGLQLEIYTREMLHQGLTAGVWHAIIPVFPYIPTKSVKLRLESWLARCLSLV